MAVTDLIIPYPDFQDGEIMDDSQFDNNNEAIKNKVNEIIVALNTNTDKVSFPEAPNDGKQYARKSLGWEEIGELDDYLLLSGGAMTGNINIGTHIIGGADLGTFLSLSSFIRLTTENSIIIDSDNDDVNDAIFTAIQAGQNVLTIYSGAGSETDSITYNNQQIYHAGNIDSKIAANSAVTANTAKITYDDALVVESNTSNIENNLIEINNLADKVDYISVTEAIDLDTDIIMVNLPDQKIGTNLTLIGEDTFNTTNIRFKDDLDTDTNGMIICDNANHILKFISYDGITSKTLKIYSDGTFTFEDNDVFHAGTSEPYTTTEQTKVGNLSITQAVDLDTMESDVTELKANGEVITTGLSQAVSEPWVDRFIVFSNTSPIDITVLKNATVPLPDFAKIEFLVYGTGEVNFVAGADVTLVGKDGLVSNGRYSVITIKKLFADTWIVYGDLTI